MKRAFISILFVTVYSTLFAQLSQKQAYDIVKNDVLKSDTTDIHLYVSKDMIASNSTIKTMYKDIISPDFTSWLFFIDDAPYQNWGHPSRFVFVDLKGHIEVKPYSYPPDLGNMEILIEKKYMKTDRSKLQIKSNRTAQFRNTSTAQNEYAVIISGGYDRFNNYERYWNDCAAIYSTLVNKYNYDRSHIYVLMSDGTNPATDRRRLNGTYDSSPLDLDGDGTNDVQFAATRANITAVFNTLSGIMTNADNLFIFTTDHGGVHSGQDVFMYLWYQTIEDYQLATEVNKINAKTINIVMEQCNSGGFIDNLSGYNRVIATACRADQSSYAMPPNYDYNEFVFHWTSAVAGQTPLGVTVNANTNNDGFISAHEAFSFARNRDTQSETPQYSSQPSNLGQELTLMGLTPTLSGPSIACKNTTVTYTVDNLPAGATVTWNVPSAYFTPVSISNTAVTYTVGTASSTSVTVSVSVSVGGSHVVTLQKTLKVNPPNTGSGTISGSSSVACGYTEDYCTSLLSSGCTPLRYEWLLDGDLVSNSACVSIQSVSRPPSKTAAAGIEQSDDGSPILRYPPPGRITNCVLTLYVKNSSGSIISSDSKRVRVCNYPHAIGAVQRNAQNPESGSHTVSIYPNPATDAVNVEIQSNVLTAGRAAAPLYTVQLWHEQRGLLRSVESASSSTQLSLAGLPAGMYMVHVLTGGETVSRQIIWKQ